MFRLKSKNGIHANIIFFILLSGLCISRCEDDLLDSRNEHAVNNLQITSDSQAIHELAGYYNLLKTLKKEGFVFYDFSTYLKTDSTKLPPKLIVIRHDIHSRDIQYAYATYAIEKKIIGPGHSSFFVMLDDPVEIAAEGKGIEKNYLGFLHYLDSLHVDIEPHISPIDMYISKKHPVWEHYPVDSLKHLFDRNYRWDVGKDGRTIKITGKDVFHINDIDKTLVGLLADFNKEWTKETGLRVQGYAAHGSSTPMNMVLNNAYLFDQYCLLHTGLYKYDAYNTKILHELNYLSDNKLPSWMDDPSSIRPGRYELLMHPYQWRPDRNFKTYTGIKKPVAIDSLIHIGI
jgi:hypothetical protein